MQESGQLQFLPTPKQGNYGFTRFENGCHLCRRSHRKTNASCDSISRKTIVFAADLIPTAGHIPQVYVMGYDTRPLLTMEEKENSETMCRE